jgi:hypothetical protein
VYDYATNEVWFYFDPPSNWMMESGTVSIRING